MAIDIIKLLRPHQWLKNLFCFLPLFFGRHLYDVDYILPCVVIFLAFSLAASGIYCLNDIRDADDDRKHPKKCMRPIASGKISKQLGLIIMVACFAISFLLIEVNSFVNIKNKNLLYGLITFYIITNILYCIKLKHIPILDVFIISFGFVVRVLIGGYATGIWISHWIILMTFLLALFLSFAKRRDDVVLYEETGMKMRDNINQYNISFLNLAIGIIASVTMVCYILYTVSPEVTERIGSNYLYMTSLFVLAGIMRYLQITFVDINSGSPTNILIKDHFIQLCILGWIVMFGCILYF